MRKRTLTLPRVIMMTLAVTLTLVLTWYTDIYLVKNRPISENLGWVFLFVFLQFVFDLVVVVDDVVPGTRELIKVFIQLEVLHDSLQHRENNLVKLQHRITKEQEAFQWNANRPLVACANRRYFNSHQMSAPVGVRSWSEQVWRALQWWPPDVTSRGSMYNDVPWSGRWGPGSRALYSEV